MKMNPATVLMCWNIPQITEELVYELFSIAGPINDISFGQTGKSCFIVYEHEDAVVTAKEIFKDLKLSNRPLRIFDLEEIEKIYSNQEERVASPYDSNSPYESRGYPCSNSRYAPPSSKDFRMQPNFSNYSNSNCEKYYGTDMHASSNYNDRVFHSRNQKNYFDNEDRGSVSMHKSSMTNHGYHSRTDLVPSTSTYSSQKRKFDSNDSIYNPDNFFENSNPYKIPVSRNLREIPSGNPRDGHANSTYFDRTFPAEDSQSNVSSFRQNTGRNFDPLIAFQDIISRGESKQDGPRNFHSGNQVRHYRDSSSNMRHHDRRDHGNSRGSKFHDLPPPGVNYKSRNPYKSKQNRRYHEPYDKRSSKY